MKLLQPRVYLKICIWGYKERSIGRNYLENFHFLCVILLRIRFPGAIQLACNFRQFSILNILKDSKVSGNWILMHTLVHYYSYYYYISSMQPLNFSSWFLYFPTYKMDVYRKCDCHRKNFCDSFKFWQSISFTSR